MANGYLSCSQFVPQVPTRFPIAAHFIPHFVLPQISLLVKTLDQAQKKSLHTLCRFGIGRVRSPTYDTRPCEQVFLKAIFNFI